MATIVVAIISFLKLLDDSKSDPVSATEKIHKTLLKQ